jgi:hypothetical protein
VAGEKDLVAKADTFPGLEPESPQANDRNVSRSGGPSEMSRHLAQPSSADVLVHFAQEMVELARSDVPLHLLIPFVVFPAMEPGSKFGPLLKRELFDGSLDLVNAHRVQ